MSFLDSRTRSARQGFGKPVPRTEDARLLIGNGCYSDDFNLPGQAYASLVRSPHAHARIRRIDTAAALATPGVVALLAALGAGHHYVAEHAHFVAGNDSASLNCLPCHVYTAQDGLLGKVFQERYLSPREIAVARDGRRLYVTAEEDDALLVVQLHARTVLDRIPVGKHPHTVVLSRDGRTAYVSNGWSGSVSQVDLTARRVSREFAVGDGPAGMVLDSEERVLYVANGGTNDISVVDLESGRERHRLAGGQNPHGVALAPDGDRVYVTSRLSNPVPFRTPPVTEVTVVDARTAGRSTPLT